MSSRLKTYVSAVSVIACLAGAGESNAQSVLRVAMTAGDIPDVTGQPDQGFEGYRFVGYTLHDRLILWDLSKSDSEASLKPGLATKWYVDPNDKKRWVFELRQGVKFHDGCTFDADTVVWNIERLINDKAPHFNPKQFAAMRTRTANLVGAEFSLLNWENMKHAILPVTTLCMIPLGILNRVVAHVRAVDGVSFCVMKGETLGIVGESGCGKSTIARLIMQLVPSDEGAVIFDGEPISSFRGLPLKEFRRNAQMIFQDSYSSLNPRLPVEASVAYGPRVHGASSRDALKIAHDILGKVGLRPELYGSRYPHELSGGQKQRVNIARALALEPRLLVLDEAVSALDKSVEAQVLNLPRHLKRVFNLTYVFISHDLNVVQHISDRVLVMYLGEIVEIGPVEDIYSAPNHPYTRALLNSRLSMDPAERVEEAPLTGDPPNPIDPPSGCRFRTRCPHAEAVCAARSAILPDHITNTAHVAACHMTDPTSGHSLATCFPAGASAPKPSTILEAAELARA